MKLPDLPIIDLHTHLGEYHEFPIRQSGPEAVSQQAEELGIVCFCCSHMWSFSVSSHEGNSLVLEAAQHHPGLLPSGVLDPNDGENDLAAEIERLSPHVAMWGEWHPCLHRYPLDGPKYRFMLEIIRRDPKPVLFHTDASDAYSQPHRIETFLQDFPEIPFILGHSGNVIGGFEEAINLAKKYDNAFLDTAFSRNVFGLPRFMLNGVGAEKILFGSDMPFLNAPAQIGKWLTASIPVTAREAIFYRNAKQLLSLSL